MASTPSKRKMNDSLADKENVIESAKKTKTLGGVVKPTSRLAIPTRGRSALPRPGTIATSKSTSSLATKSVTCATTSATTVNTVPTTNQEAVVKEKSKTPNPVRGILWDNSRWPFWTGDGRNFANCWKSF